MKITDIVPRIIRKKAAEAEWNPRIVWNEKTVFLVELETSEGVVGLGEGWCDGLSPELLAYVIEKDLKPLLLGMPLDMTARIWDTVFQKSIYSAKQGLIHAALSAIDIAVWDARSKALNLPVYKLIGGHSDKVFVYGSAGLYGKDKTPEDLGREMAGYVAKGFKAVKMKAGGAPLREDVARVAAVREAIGPDIRLMVDALYALNVADAIKFGREIEKYDVYFLEAPVLPTDILGLSAVNARCPVPVAGNEFAYGRHTFRDIIENNGVAFVHLDTIVCGGISEALKVAAMASARHLPCSFHSSSSVVCFAANLHAGACVANCDSVEYHMLHQVLFDAVSPGLFELKDGFLKMPQTPGLGFTIEDYSKV